MSLIICQQFPSKEQKMLFVFLFVWREEVTWTPQAIWKHHKESNLKKKKLAFLRKIAREHYVPLAYVFITRQASQAFITEKQNMIIIIHLPSTAECFVFEFIQH